MFIWVFGSSRMFAYSSRDVERRPVLCSFARIEGSSAYQKKKYVPLLICNRTPSVPVPRSASSMPFTSSPPLESRKRRVLITGPH